MKLLFLPTYFSPEKAASIYIADNRYEAFAKAGFDMLAYAPYPSRGLSKEEQLRYASIPEETLYDGKMMLKRFQLSAEGKNPIKRVFRYFVQNVKQYGWAKRNAGDADLVFVSSTPPLHGFMAGRLRNKMGIPFVYNVQDIFPDSLVGTGLARRNGLIWRIGNAIESITYRNADKIIVISEDFKKNIMAKGVPEEKIVVIYNWVDEDAVKEVARSENKLFDKYNLDRSKFYITYSGNIGLTQNMDMLLEVMAELQTEAPDIQLVLVGEGAYKEQVVRKIAGQAGNDGAIRGTVLPNVIMLPFQPYEDISYVFSLGDAGLVISKPGVGANSVPSKTWSIMSASRPVLANFDENELKDIVTTHHCGIFTKAGDKEAFKASVLELYHNSELCKEYGRNGRQFVMENLTKEVGTQKYVDVIKSFEKQ